MLSHFRTEDTAKAALQKAGIYDPKVNQFRPPAIELRLRKITIKARATSGAWSAISEVSVHMEDEAGFAALDNLVLPMGESGFDLPQRVIEEAAIHASPLGITDSEWTGEDLAIARGVEVPFAETLIFADSLLKNPREFLRDTPWPFVQAVRYLIRRRPELLVSAFNVLVQGYKRTLDGDSATFASGPWPRAISLAVRNIATSLYFARAAAPCLMQSSAPLLRALGAETWFGEFHEGCELEPPSTIYCKLPEIEQALMLARGAHLLRAERARLYKRLGDTVDVELRDSKLRLLQPRLLENWPRAPSQEVLREIAHAFSGPLEGADAPELYRIFEQAAFRTGFDMQLGLHLLLNILIEKLQQFASGKRVRPWNIDRLLLVWLYRLYPSLLDAIIIVQPETVIR